MRSISARQSFCYSLLVHALFLGVLVMSWGHMPTPDPVQVVLWSKGEMREAAVAEARPHEAKKSAPTPLVTKPAKVKAPAKVKVTPPEAPATDVAHRLKKWWGGEEEAGDIQVERHLKKHHRKPKKEVKPEPVKTPEVVKPKTPEVAKPKSNFKAVAEAERKLILNKPLPKPKEVPRDTSKDKESELEDRLDLASAEAAAEKAAPKHAAVAKPATEASAHGRASSARLESYRAKVIRKIRGNLEWFGDEEVPRHAEITLILLPNGELDRIESKRSSGSARYDSAVEQAIIASSPFPPPEAEFLGDRRLIIRMKP